MPASRHLSLTPLLLTFPLLLAQANPTPPTAPPSVAVNRNIPMSLSSFTDDTSFVKVTKETEPPSAKLTADTLKFLKQSGDFLKSIHLTAHVYQEECLPLGDGPHPWLQAGTMQGEGFLELATGRERFDVFSHYDDWAHDPGTHDQKILQVFDGKNHQQVPAQFGWGAYSGPPRPMPISAAELLGTYFAFPLDIGSEEKSDRRSYPYPLYARLDPTDASARRVLLNFAQPAIELTFHHNIDDTKITETWYLDPDHGYARIASSRDLDPAKNDHHWTHTVIFRLLLTPQGAYYPESAIQIFGTDHTASRRSYFTASSIFPNDTPPDSYFTLPAAPTKSGP